MRLTRKESNRPEPQNILIVGATGGIGESIVRLLDTPERSFTFVCRDLAKTEAAFHGLKASWDVVICDLTETASVTAAAEQLGEREFDAIVVNAGVVEPLPTLLATPEHLLSHYLINVISPLQLVTPQLQSMLDRKNGRLVANVSNAALAPLKNYGAYSASKAAMRTQLQSLRQELYPFVSVSAVFLSGVDTPMLESENASPYGSPLNYLSDPVSAEDAARTIVATVLAPRPKAETYAPRSDATMGKLTTNFPNVSGGLVRKLEAVARKKMPG